MGQESMMAKRLKQLRLARGLSQDDLALLLDGLVSKAMLSKYETGKSNPSATVLRRLASVFGIRAADFWAEPSAEISLIAFRCDKNLPDGERSRVEARVAEFLEQCVRLQVLLDEPRRLEVPINQFKVESFEEADDAAAELRTTWNLGYDPIPSVVNIVEDHGVRVLGVDTEEGFDGISAVARDTSTKEYIAAAVVSRATVSGDRQRFNIAHELGHLVMNVDGSLGEAFEEKCAHRFAAAFLAPRDLVLKYMGPQRTSVDFGELMLMKKDFGISIQASVLRLRDLGVISSALYESLWRLICSFGWKKEEPCALEAESPHWFDRSVRRAHAEGLVSTQDAERLLSCVLATDTLPVGLLERKAFLKLSVEQRRQVLAEQMRDASEHSEMPDTYVEGNWLNAE